MFILLKIEFLLAIFFIIFMFNDFYYYDKCLSKLYFMKKNNYKSLGKVVHYYICSLFECSLVQIKKKKKK